MEMRLYPVCPELRLYVKEICSMEGDSCDTLTPPLRVLPDACVELFVNFSHSSDTFSTVTGKKVFENSRSFVVSRMSNFMDVQMKNKTRFISICFYPSAACLFFHLPMTDIVDSLTDLHSLWGSVVYNMEDEVDRTATKEQKAKIIQKYLLYQFNSARYDKTLEYCMQQIDQAGGNLTVGALADRAGLSQRQLSRKFNHNLGLSTKEYLTVSRFINSLAYLKKHPEYSLTDIAYASGYYDQAHFIHDYKIFAGFTPKVVLHENNIIC